ncbi:Bacteriophage recombination protein [Rhizobium freirei PRF 81]|uniref:Bacteriophage recombination protein n=1 Tax=Rhizobium freirei PRF 81 TaxID=363754 RepID=N6VDJ4_9HYPH|nr:recombinase RecT [Rhizobium freirei]ENN89117.1 Bacteriophage recombination protein [Rhizobium freirei PRF 81]
MNQIATIQKRSLVDSMAAKYDMEPTAFVNAIKATVIKGECSNEQFAAFLMVAKEYDLNPLTKEIYAFPDRGGITPIVSIDGWMNLINSHPQFDGMEFVDTNGADGKLHSVECKMYRKDRQRPTTVIEYMSECFRQTDPWKKWPNRMLRHKAAIQCARYAFGFSGIMEPDEYERMKDVTPAKPVTLQDRLQAAREAAQEPDGEREGFDASFVQSETESALNGEILTDNPNSGPTPSEPDTADSGALSASAASDDAPSSPSSDAPLSDADLRKHLMEFALKAFTTLADRDLDAAVKSDIIEEMTASYKADVIHKSQWAKMSSVTVAFKAVFAGKRTIDEARSYVAIDVLDCSTAELGGAA